MRENYKKALSLPNDFVFPTSVFKEKDLKKVNISTQDVEPRKASEDSDCN
jgi:hypothetical protein